MRKICMLLILAISFYVAKGQAGSLDPSFGTNGLVKTSFPSTAFSSGPAFEVIPDASGKVYVIFYAGGLTAISRHLADGTIDVSYAQNGYTVPIRMQASAAVMQPDGKIVMAGSVFQNNNQDIAVARVNADGTLDNSFAGDGIQNTDIVLSTEFASDVALQPDGKIVVAGTAGGDFVVVRYNPDGTPDNSFSGDGIVLTDFGTADESARDVVIQPDGKIVVAGNVVAGTNVFGLARYLPNGTLDNSFSFDGKTTMLVGNFCFASSAALQSDGKIVVAGVTFTSSGPSFAVARFNTDGSPDNSFSGDGQQITDISPFDDRAEAVVIQTDGKIVAGGNATVLGDNDFALVRYNTDGTPDNSFSGDGIVTTNIGGSLDLIFSMALMADGRIVAGGYASSKYGMARYLSNGTLDNSFSGDGIVTGGLPDGTTGYQTSTVQSDGKIVAAGTAFVDDRFMFAIARYNTDGSLDNGFSGDGIQTVDFGPAGFNIVNAVAIMPDGRIVVAGAAFSGTTTDFAVVRLNSDGSPDNSFSGDGKLLLDLRGEEDYGYDMAIQPDGKIVIAGYSYLGGQQDFAVARLNADGSPDNSFSGDGKAFTDFGSPTDFATAMAIQADGKIILAGIADFQNPGDNSNIALARYTVNGDLDASFDFDGRVITDYFGKREWVGAMALQTDGKIVVAATLSDNNINDFALVRYNTNGSLDNSFSGSGKVVFDGGSTTEMANALAIQTNGKILVGGYINGTSLDFAVLRFNTDGTPDNSFSGDGIVTTDFASSEDVAESISIFGNHLYAVGRSSSYGIYNGALAAYFIEDLCTISANIPDAMTLGTGVNANTVYVGYAPASDLTLTAEVSGGTAPYSYSWSNGATTASITVMPTVATSYTVTVTDANGCVAVANKLVNVVDVRCGNGKVLVCKVPQGNPANAATNCVGANAVDELLRKGSYLGNCTQQNLITSKAIESGLRLVASPNPTNNVFSLDIRSDNAARAELIVWDATGRLVEKITVMPNTIVKLGAAYRHGIYMVEVRQGDERANLKLFKIE